MNGRVLFTEKNNFKSQKLFFCVMEKVNYIFKRLKSYEN
ncbi:hypothetical protein HDE70_001209 [Pedobacter cryoconitis]|nr:hypothetical protein [Pedobacter cryoconitis]